MSSYTLATRINNLEQIADDVYTKGQTDFKLFELISGAPESLNTLYELSRAINDDPQFYQDISNSIATKQDIFSASNRLNASLIAAGIVSNAEFNLLNGLTQNIQTSLDSKHPLITASSTLDPLLIGNGLISSTEFDFLNGCTANIQTSLNTLTSTKQNNK